MRHSVAVTKRWTSTACIIALVALSACATPYQPVPRKATFNPAEYTEYAAEGTASFSGVLHAKLRLGDPRLSPEHVVLLMPVTAYVAERIEKEYVDQVALWPPLNHLAHHAMRARVTDNQREFRFEKLPAGAYSVGCFLESREPRPEFRAEPYGLLDGRWVFSPINLAKGENLQVVLTEQCIPEIQIVKAPPPEPEIVQPEPPPPPPEPAVTLAAHALFDTGKAELRPEGREILKQLADLLKTVSGKDIRIEGHTDNVPIRGRLRAKYPTNLELSTARAVTVLRYLVEEGGLAREIFTTIGHADTRPVASNDTPEGRQENRRIEIFFLPKPSAPAPSS